MTAIEVISKRVYFGEKGNGIYVDSPVVMPNKLDAYVLVGCAERDDDFLRAYKEIVFPLYYRVLNERCVMCRRKPYIPTRGLPYFSELVYSPGRSYQRGGMVLMYRIARDTVKISASICSLSDSFSRKIGREFAYARSVLGMCQTIYINRKSKNGHNSINKGGMVKIPLALILGKFLSKQAIEEMGLEWLPSM